MEYVNLGKTGLKVSRITLGCMTFGAPVNERMPGRHMWTLTEAESQPFLKQALDFGINFFDTANVYSSGESEEVVGRFLKANVRREAVVIATKVHGVMRQEPNGQGFRAKRSSTNLMKVCAVSKPIMSIFTRYIAGTTTPLSKRRWKRFMTW